MKLKRKIRLEGLCDMARELNCTPGHLSQVLHGKRKPGRALRAELERRGETVPQCAEKAPRTPKAL